MRARLWRAIHLVWQAAKNCVLHWRGCGIPPRRLALTLALGFAVGCIPMVGIPTVLCAVLAIIFRLNHPVIQTANYAAMPLQFVLVAPLARMGGQLVPMHTTAALGARMHLHLSAVPLNRSTVHLAAWLGGLAGQALLAWLLIALPTVALLTLALTVLFERIGQPDEPEDAEAASLLRSGVFHQ